jgi:hypothetical protein
MKTIKEMARKSKIDVYGLGCPHVKFMQVLEAFAALVREDEAERYKWDVHSCGPTCERYACVAMREAVLAEREACAKVIESHGPFLANGAMLAAAVRARSST